MIQMAAPKGWHPDWCPDFLVVHRKTSEAQSTTHNKHSSTKGAEAISNLWDSGSLAHKRLQTLLGFSPNDSNDSSSGMGERKEKGRGISGYAADVAADVISNYLMMGTLAVLHCQLASTCLTVLIPDCSLSTQQARTSSLNQLLTLSTKRMQLMQSFVRLSL